MRDTSTAENISKYLNFNIKSLMRDGFWVFLPQITGLFTGAATFWFLTNNLEKHILGEYQFFIAIITLLGIVVVPSIESVMSREISGNPSLDISKSIKDNSKWMFIAIFAGLLISTYYYINQNYLLSTGIFVAAMFAPLYLYIERFSLGLMKGMKKYKALSFFELLIRFTMATALILASFISPSALYVLIAFLGVKLISRGFLFVYVYSKFNNGSNKTPVSTEKDLDLYMILGTVLSLSYLSEKFIIWNQLGSESMADYSVATYIPEQTSIIISVLISSMLIPRIARMANPRKVFKFLPKILLLFSVISVFSIVIYSTVNEHIFEIIFSRYQELNTLSTLLSVKFFLFLVFNIIWYVLFSLKDNATLKRVALLQLVCVCIIFVIPKRSLHDIVSLFLLKELVVVVLLLTYIYKKDENFTTSQKKLKNLS